MAEITNDDLLCGTTCRTVLRRQISAGTPTAEKLPEAIPERRYMVDVDATETELEEADLEATPTVEGGARALGVTAAGEGGAMDCR